MTDETKFTVTDAINSVILQTREHTDPEDPRAEASGSETLLGRYGLTTDDIEKPLQQYTIRAALPMMANGELDSAFMGIFLAGAVWADRQREAKSDPKVCPACGSPAQEVVSIEIEDPATGRSSFYKCANGHRWDREAGALI